MLEEAQLRRIGLKGVIEFRYLNPDLCGQEVTASHDMWRPTRRVDQCSCISSRALGVCCSGGNGCCHGEYFRTAVGMCSRTR